MKNLFLLLASTFAPFMRNAPKYKQQNKHSAHCGRTFFTQAGDVVFTDEYTKNEALFGAICIQLKEAYNSLTHAERVLLNFMTNLKLYFDLEHLVAGEAINHQKEKERFLSFYGQDTTGVDWKVCGWTNGDTMAVLYIRNINHLPVAEETQFFSKLQFVAA